MIHAALGVGHKSEQSLPGTLSGNQLDLDSGDVLRKLHG